MLKYLIAIVCCAFPGCVGRPGSLVVAQSAPPPAGRLYSIYKVSPMGGALTGAGAFQIFSGNYSGNWSPSRQDDILGVPLMVQSGQRFESISASVYGNTSFQVTMTVYAQDDAFHVGGRLGSDISEPSNTIQTLAVIPTIQGVSGGDNEVVTPEQRSYMVQFRAHQVAALSEGAAFVGPITLVMSSPIAGEPMTN